MVQDQIDLVWRQISEIDSIGRTKLVELCGGSRLQDLLSGARTLAKLLTAVRRSLDSATGSLQCDRMNPIYIQAAHNALCTNAASASAYGFVLFFALAIATMTMISLRASWLRNIVEEKVFHDEDEVAENMILDEHEEYLNYISKYKHEWQEYKGIENSTFGRRSDDGSFDDEDSRGSIYFEGSAPRSSSRYGDDGSRTDGEGYNGSDECSVEGASGKLVGLDSGAVPTSKAPSPLVKVVARWPSVVKDVPRQPRAGIDDIDDISFPSLPANKSGSSSSIDEIDKFVMPAPLLPPRENPDFRDDDQASIEAGKQQAAPDMTDLVTMKIFDKYVCETKRNQADQNESTVSPRGPGTPNDRYDATVSDDDKGDNIVGVDEIEVTLSRFGAESNTSVGKSSREGKRSAKAALSGLSKSRGPNIHRAQSAPKPTTPKWSGQTQITFTNSCDNRSRAEI
jgi:hypothetical protein